jgi:hypothetical protein
MLAIEATGTLNAASGSCQVVDRCRKGPARKKGVISKFVTFKCLILPDFLGMVLAFYFTTEVLEGNLVGTYMSEEKLWAY